MFDRLAELADDVAIGISCLKKVREHTILTDGMTPLDGDASRRLIDTLVHNLTVVQRSLVSQ